MFPHLDATFATSVIYRPFTKFDQAPIVIPNTLLLQLLYCEINIIEVTSAHTVPVNKPLPTARLTSTGRGVEQRKSLSFELPKTMQAAGAIVHIA